MIVSSFCFALKSVIVNISAVWPRGHGHHVRGCTVGGGLSAVAVPCWPALGLAGCTLSQVWPPPLRVGRAYCRVMHRATPCFPYHLAPPCSERSQPLTSPTSALHSCDVCNAFRRVNHACALF
jgi:hypothetical protein